MYCLALRAALALIWLAASERSVIRGSLACWGCASLYLKGGWWGVSERREWV
jgi:hypothetical protein